MEKMSPFDIQDKNLMNCKPSHMVTASLLLEEWGQKSERKKTTFSVRSSNGSKNVNTVKVKIFTW